MPSLDDRPMMTCGHAANAKSPGPDGTWSPSCAICDCITVADERPDLSGRFAHCTTCHQARVPSRWGLAFFEYCGPGSYLGTTVCKHCHLHQNLHPSQNPKATGEDSRGYRFKNLCENNGGTYESLGGLDEDLYYCGCRGWE